MFNILILQLLFFHFFCDAREYKSVNEKFYEYGAMRDWSKFSCDNLVCFFI